MTWPTTAARPSATAGTGAQLVQYGTLKAALEIARRRER